MKNFTKILAGMSYIVIALVSLLVVLFWPYQLPDSNSHKVDDGKYRVEQNTYGWPTTWLYDTTIGPEMQGSANALKIAEGTQAKNTKEYDAKHLLINLIVWAVFLTLVTFGFKAISRMGSK